MSAQPKSTSDVRSADSVCEDVIEVSQTFLGILSSSDAPVVQATRVVQGCENF